MSYSGNSTSNLISLPQRAQELLVATEQYHGPEVETKCVCERLRGLSGEIIYHFEEQKAEVLTESLACRVLSDGWIEAPGKVVVCSRAAQQELHYLRSAWTSQQPETES